ncbi:methylenetetrahydrofolate reductase [Saccharopolyspora sp. HNM0983]|uniref:Methylenetetrahydrofolate reductase n=1 Tax=Saccharopolyspora montiporae TaxID=2781240 RepID=A0A929B8Y4_9PSEU|nr:methylenetetrahydrofolate reductase [Saccharopolyspora sp. HNM0983]MBE9373242.1 methylenetetrahydrofolate reductase [Saccharopolyspora sp. HNM0983]
MITNPEQLRQHLLQARFEVLPLRGAVEQAAQLPAGSTVTVTASASKGPDRTVEVAIRLRELGLHVVPHLAARSITGQVQLAELLDRTAAAGIDEVFVIAGDRPEPVGEFADAPGLLSAIEELGRRPARIGIAGYPESHAFIPDVETARALDVKARHADYVVSQICFDPAATGAWIRAVRERGMTLPIHIGAPGVVDMHRLLRISLKIGLGDSLRFLRKQPGVVSKLLTRYTPEALFDELAHHLADPVSGVAGWHLFTFNEVAKTLQWRQELAQRLREVPA